MSQVKNKFLAQMAAHTYKGNNTGSTANPIDVTNTQLTADLNLFTTSLQGLVPASGGGTVNFLRADGTWTTISLTTNISGILPILNGGTNASTASQAFINLSPLTTAGDLIFENATPAPTRLPIGSTGQVLTVVAGLPAWATSTSSLTGLGIRTGQVSLSSSVTT